jgi:hypothetical protein
VDGDFTNVCYFHARFLELRGQAEEAKRLYQLCAASPYTAKMVIPLAMERLRHNKWEIPERRKTEFTPLGTGPGE